MSNVTRLPPFPKSVHVEADIRISQRDEFERAIVEIVAGARSRMDALDLDVAGVYNGQAYPVHLTELRGVDTELANGDRALHRWIEHYEIKPRRGG